MIRMNGSGARIAAATLFAAGMVGLAACSPQTRDEAGEAADQLGDVVDSAGDDMGTAAVEVAAEAGVAWDRAAVQMDRMGEQIESGTEYAAEAAADDVARLRSDLAIAYENAEGEAAEEWAELQPELEKAEMALRAGSANALDNLSELLTRTSRSLCDESPNRPACTPSP